jgi:alkylation response protein AidB-like acyl-CoA dehydrogenase
MAFGTDEQKTRFLPGILNGDIHFCVGYSEPNAGTDLASLKTRAVRDGDEYVINGEKAFTSLATDADFVWMAARTDLEAAKHRGISIFVVPMDAPGVTVVPMRMLSEHDVAATFYADVRVPADAMVGGENNGWTMITSQLNHERVTLCPSGTIERLLEEVVGWAKSSPLPDGRHVIEQEWVRLNLARVRAKLEFLKLMNWKVAWSATQGRLDVADASTVKVFGTEFYLEAFRLLSEVIGEPAYLNRDSPGAVIGGRLESLYRDLLIQTFGGGTNEIQRDLIATFGLGMPRPPR